MARPPKFSSSGKNTLDARIPQIRVAQEDLDRLKRGAEEAGVLLTDHIRSVILNRYGSHSVMTSSASSDVRECVAELSRIGGILRAISGELGDPSSSKSRDDVIRDIDSTLDQLRDVVSKIMPS